MEVVSYCGTRQGFTRVDLLLNRGPRNRLYHAVMARSEPCCQNNSEWKRQPLSSHKVILCEYHLFHILRRIVASTH